MFHGLANLPCDYGSITKSLNKRSKRQIVNATSQENLSELVMEGSHPALPAEPGTLKATLPDTPGIGQMTERESAHPNYQQLEQHVLTNGVKALNVTSSQNVTQNGDSDGQKKDLLKQQSNGVESPSPTKHSVNTVMKIFVVR